MRVALGADLNGYAMKEAVKHHLADLGHEVVDFGVAANEDLDYPDVALPVARAVAAGEVDRAVLVCGTGLGMAIVANKVPGVRAAVVHDVTSGHLAREHNHANVLCMGGRLIGTTVAVETLKAWLDATPEARHEPRIEKLAALDAEYAEKR